MKKVIFGLMVVSVLAACNGGSGNSSATTDSTKVTTDSTKVDSAKVDSAKLVSDTTKK